MRLVFSMLIVILMPALQGLAQTKVEAVTVTTPKIWVKILFHPVMQCATPDPSRSLLAEQICFNLHKRFLLTPVWNKDSEDVRRVAFGPYIQVYPYHIQIESAWLLENGVQTKPRTVCVIKFDQIGAQFGKRNTDKTTTSTAWYEIAAEMIYDELERFVKNSVVPNPVKATTH